MKTQRKVEAGALTSRDSNKKMTKPTKRILSPKSSESKSRPFNCGRDRKAQYLKKEKDDENQCASNRGVRKSISDDARPWLIYSKASNKPDLLTLKSNSSLVNGVHCNPASPKDAPQEEEAPTPQQCEQKPMTRSSKPMEQKILKLSQCNDDEGEKSTDDVGTKYLRLLEKYTQQGKLVQVVEEQLSGLRTLIEECTGENQHLVGLLKEKEDREAALTKELEEAKKEIAKNLEEKNRYNEERTIHEQIVKRLNKKLSV